MNSGASHWVAQIWQSFWPDYPVRLKSTLLIFQKVETPKKPVAPKKLVTPKLTKGGRKLPPLPKSLGPDEYDAYDEQLMMTPKILLRTLKRSIIEDKMPKPKEYLEEIIDR